MKMKRQPVAQSKFALSKPMSLDIGFFALTKTKNKIFWQTY